MKIREIIEMLSEFSSLQQDIDVAAIVVDGATSSEQVRLYDGSDGEPFAMVEAAPAEGGT